MNQLEKDWKQLVDYGPRFMGTAGAQQTVNFLYRSLQEFCTDVRLQPFEYLGWGVAQPLKLEVLEPAPREIRCEVCTFSGPTPDGGVVGTLEYVGRFLPWGWHTYDRFAIVSDQGETVAYIHGRHLGPAFPHGALGQPGEYLPAFCIGRDDLQWVNDWRRDEKIVVRAESHTSYHPKSIGHNVIARFPGSMPDSGTIVLNAHYDSQYNTVGATDNATGTAILLQIASWLAENPQPNTWELVFFGAEELNLDGAYHYVREAKANGSIENIRLCATIEGMGRGDEMEIWVGPERILPQTKRLFDAFDHPRPMRKRYDCPPPPGSDHAAFHEVGIPALMFTITIESILHQPLDNVADAVMLRNSEYAYEMVKYFISNVSAVLK